MTNEGETSTARQVDAAQSILQTPAASRARMLELATAATCRAFAAAMAKLDPEVNASAREIAGGVAIFAGLGSPITQGLAIGLAGPVTSADLDAMEAHLHPSGEGACQLEISPYVDPSLPALLAERGYRVHEWQLVWERDVPNEPLAPPPADITVRRTLPGEEDAYLHAVLAGFFESEEVPDDAMRMMRPSAFAEGYELYLALSGDEILGGATLAVSGRIAMVNGSGVRPAFRRRGAQGALIRARLDRARELGCEVAASCTLPGTASRRNMERHGFHVAYPKVLMLRDS